MYTKFSLLEPHLVPIRALSFEIERSMSLPPPRRPPAPWRLSGGGRRKKGGLPARPKRHTRRANPVAARWPPEGQLIRGAAYSRMLSWPQPPPFLPLLCAPFRARVPAFLHPSSRRLATRSKVNTAKSTARTSPGCTCCICSSCVSCPPIP
jgi:hypothetical protein